MHIKKLLCAILTIYSFSIFAQETEDSESESVDLAQNFLAKSATAVEAVAWTRDGKYFATSWNNSVILWDAATNAIAAVYSNAVDETSNPLANVISLHFSDDGLYLLSVRDDNTVLIHSIGGNGDSTLIRGTGTQMSEAVYTGGSYRMVFPLDGMNLYESFKLMATGEYIIEEKVAMTEQPWALSTTPNGRKLLVTGKSGTVSLIDTESWETEMTFSKFVQTGVKPRFAPDSVHYVAAENQSTLLVASISDESDFYTIEDQIGFCHAAEFSNDSTKIAAALNSGCVKLYDIASGLEETQFQLLYGDTAKSLVFSPDDLYVIIGTEKGYIYRWVLSGGEFIPDYSGYQDKIDEYRENKLENSLVLSLGYGRVGSNYYIGNGIFEAGYKNYFRPPFYWGLNGSIGAGLPGSEFPYTYYEGGESLSSPFLYSLATGGLIGLVYYNKTYDFHVFSEAGGGVNMRLLFNNSITYPHMSNPVFGAYVELLVGLQWKWVRAWGGVQFDTNLHWLMNAHVGVAIPTRNFRRRK